MNNLNFILQNTSRHVVNCMKCLSICNCIHINIKHKLFIIIDIKRRNQDSHGLKMHNVIQFAKKSKNQNKTNKQTNKPKKKNQKNEYTSTKSLNYNE